MGARPAGWVNCFSICASAMLSAQNRTAKGSILKKAKYFAHLGVDILYNENKHYGALFNVFELI